LKVALIFESCLSNRRRACAHREQFPHLEGTVERPHNSIFFWLMTYFRTSYSIIIIIIRNEYDYGGVMSEDC